MIFSDFYSKLTQYGSHNEYKSSPLNKCKIRIKCQLKTLKKQAVVKYLVDIIRIGFPTGTLM